MNYKNIVVSWLFETELSNMNAGEGSSNLKEIKTYNNGLPYISGQSMRHALRQAMKRENSDDFKCTPEFPCGDITNCWTCDLFGYLLPSQGAKRWSPIKASPALGQIRNSITTDLIFRMVEDIECPECHDKIYPLAARSEGVKEIKKDTDLKCPKCGKTFNAPYDIRQAIAYKQLMKNIYKSSISIDVANIGVEEVPVISEDGKMNATKPINNIGCDKKIERIKSILNGIYNLSDFANQSREMVNSTPDFVIISLQKRYNHRLASVLKLDEDGNMDIKVLESVIEDTLSMDGTKVYAGFISGIIKNEEEVMVILNKFNEDESVDFNLCDTPFKAFNEVCNELDCKEVDGDTGGSA